MLELHFKQPLFTYSAWRSFIKYRERFQKFREIGNSRHLFNKWIKQGFFAHDATYSDSEDLTKGAFSDKTLIDRAFEIARNSKYDV